MKKLVRGSRKTEIYGMKIDKSLKKYENDPRVLKKLAQAEETIARIGLPSDCYEKQESTYENTLLCTEELAIASEPQAEYGVSKKVEA